MTSSKEYVESVTMFRTVNKLGNNNLLRLLRCSGQVNSVAIAPEVLSRVVWRNGSSVVGTGIPRRNVASTTKHLWSDKPNDWKEPYLTTQSRTASVEDIVRTILSSPNPETQVEKLPPLKRMACDDLIAMLIAFDDAGLAAHCRIVQTLVEEITDQMKDNPQAVSTYAMANFSVFANQNRHKMNKYLLCVDMIGPLQERLVSCDNLEEMSYITVCLNNLNRFVTYEVIELYKSKLEQLMKDGKLSSDSDTTIIWKILGLITLPPWSTNNGLPIRSLLTMLLPRIEQLTDQELADMIIIYSHHLEPGAIVAPIMRLAENRLQRSSADGLHNIPLLYCCSMTEIPEKNQHILNCLDAYMDTTTDTVNDSLLFQMLRHNKKSVTEIYDKYWSKVATELASMDPKQTVNYDNMLSKACYRYCNFDNSQRGRYRYLPFEKVAMKLVIEEIETGISGMVPRKFVKLATFLLGFGSHQITHRFPESFVQRIEDMARQYTVHDLHQLSRGVELFYTRGKCKPAKSMRSRLNDDFSNQMCRVENMLDERTKRYMDSPQKSLTNLNKLIYVYSASRMPRRTAIFDKIAKAFEEKANGSDIVFSSRIIREVLNNLSKTNYVLPGICDKIVRFLYDNQSMVSGETVGRALYVLYTLGYDPADNLLLSEDEQSTQQEMVRFDVFGAIIERDFELMTGLTIVRVCLALVYYRALSMDLIEKVFNLDFLMRLEKEITICYATAPYSTRSLNYIMQLNRAVCMGYPEARIPWFQQNYIESHISSVVPKNSKFRDDIFEMLLSFIGDKSLIEIDHITPYGYRIPFVLYFNSNKEIVRPPIQKNTQELTKFAVIPLENASYCNNTKSPRGEEQLQERHLGILGFHVIQICFKDWNQLHMNLPGAKERFLKKILKLS